MKRVQLPRVVRAKLGYFFWNETASAVIFYRTLKRDAIFGLLSHPIFLPINYATRFFKRLGAIGEFQTNAHCFHRF